VIINEIDETKNVLYIVGSSDGFFDTFRNDVGHRKG